MSDNPGPTPEQRRRGANRRGFLAKLGATGLVAASAVFARSTPANAGPNYQCCLLVFSPPNVSMSTCRSGSNYTWYCSVNPHLHCTCCEQKDSRGLVIGSAAQCQYG